MGKASLALDITRHVAANCTNPSASSLWRYAPTSWLEAPLRRVRHRRPLFPRRPALKPALARFYTAVWRIAGARLYLDDSTGLVLRDLEARAWWLKTLADLAESGAIDD